MAKQVFLLGTNVLGVCERPAFFNEGVLSTPISEAFFCPVCGEVWARAVIDGTRFSVWAVPCERHTTTGQSISIHGSLWLSGSSEYIKHLPKEVLQRELLVHLNWVETTEREI